ncbi:MAG TPA: Ppx/GppA phosphatase family protein [Pyrinomonadaceae bacterium]|nr:Ppx/GppA phosphatase family protein [Pyrinomonadaceae bacterium]
MKLAAIDIGSNSIKLVVVQAETSESFTVLAQEREVVRLGQETLVSGHINSAATQRAVTCLKRFRSVADANGAEKIVASATATVREADNSAEFIRTVEEETGLHVEVLSGLEEARLIGLAASQGCTERGVTSLNIDIGGGSTEISIFRDGEPLKLISMKLGAVGLTDRFIRSDPPAPNELDALRSEIHSFLERSASELREQHWDHTTATSGTALAIGAALNHTALGVASTVTLTELRALNAKIAALNLAERKNVAGLSPQRADIIVAGGFVLEETMSSLGIDSLRICDWSLREGVIIDRLREWERSSMARPAG